MGAGADDTEPHDDVRVDEDGTRATASTDSLPDNDRRPDDDTGEQDTGSRPAWLPEKFKTPEDMAKAYGELEQRFSRRKESADDDKGSDNNETDGEQEASLRLSDRPSDRRKQEEAGEGDDKPTIDFNALSDEFMRDGELSDETLGSLEEAGIGREFVDRYIRGLQAEAAQIRGRAAEVVGGEENLNAMMEWARANLSDSEKQFFDDAWQSGDEARTKLALRGVYAQYVEANGQEAALVTGETRQSRSSVEPFSSFQDMVEAMQDSRYRTSPGYRRVVEARVEVSDF